MTSLPILLPDGYIPTVKSGDSVTTSQVIAKKSTVISSSEAVDTLSDQEEIVDLPVQLGLSPDQVGKTLKKNPGDSVVEGEVLAVKKQSLGLKELKVISRAEGTVLRFERDTGRLVIRLNNASGVSEPEIDSSGNILSPVAGVVTSVADDKITLSTEEKAIVGGFGSGKTSEGVLTMIEERPSKDEYLSEITVRAAGVILAVPYADKLMIAKADALGVVGIVCEEIAEDVEPYLSSRGLAFPLVKLAEEEYKRIVKQIGKRVLLNGETRSIIVLTS